MIGTSPLTPEAVRRFFLSYTPKCDDSSAPARAAVLVPFFMESGVLHILFTLRADTVRHHRGEVSLPGGVISPSDASHTETALREAQEEIGLSPEIVSVLGTFDTYVTLTGFSITPVVGFLHFLPVFKLNPEEVSETFSAPASLFLDDGETRTLFHPFEKRDLIVHYYRYNKYLIWGATAAIVRGIVQACAASQKGNP